MSRRQPLPKLDWSPILNVGFVTIPLCCALIGSHFHLPLLAVGLCIPPAGYIGWFYGRTGSYSVGLLAAVAWWFPYFWGMGNPAAFQTVNAAIGPLMILLFALHNCQFRATLEDAHLFNDTDSLTGLLNSQGFERLLSAEVNRGMRTRTPLAVVFIDVDDFKAFNDTRGHIQGDELLKKMGQILGSCVRNYDVAARMGGDEFTLLFPGTSAEGTRTALNRLLGQLRKTAQEYDWNVTWSVGAMVFPEPEDTATMIRAADELMYRAKAQGKDQFLVHEWNSETESAAEINRPVNRKMDLQDSHVAIMV
ncbi:MAG: GGDEF domain-containing protein [Planctomycetaceae bacterium]|nr:GGDEF domain-containing protein [Planctomycetaceae bacterium]